MKFKEWLKEKELKEVATTTSSVAHFARRTLPMITRQWLGPWGEEDPFFKKKKKKQESSESCKLCSNCGNKFNDSNPKEKRCAKCRSLEALAG